MTWDGMFRIDILLYSVYGRIKRVRVTKRVSRIVHHLLNDIGIALIAATVLGLLSHWMRQPIILGYLLAGAFIGPQVGLGMVQSAESVEIISEIGLVLLLFVIGLEIDLKELVQAGRQLLIGGLGQVPICVGLGCLFFRLPGIGVSGRSIDGIYLAMMCALSSTAIVVKILYDKKEFDTLPGRLTLGILIMQDIYAIFALALQPNLAHPSWPPIAKALAFTVFLVAAGFIFSRYVLSRVFTSIAKSPEMVLSVSIGWCATMAALAGSLSLSMEMGALIAGICVSAFPYSIHVTAKTLPLRDFFLTLFFVSLGMKITPPTVDILLPVLIISGFVVLSRFLSVYPLLMASRAGRRAAFVTSLNLAQISEFSLVIASLGFQYKHIREGTLTLMIYSMALLAVLSSYSIRFNHEVYLAFEWLMKTLRLGKSSGAGEVMEDRPHYDLALLGCHRSGMAFLNRIVSDYPSLRQKIHVIDFNPVVLEELSALEVPATFGDIASLDTLQHAHLEEVRAIILSIPDMLLRGIDNESLVRYCKDLAPLATIIATADDAAHSKLLKDLGAAFVLTPFDLAGEHLADVVTKIVIAKKPKRRGRAR
jgi:Kef-type K+ transport system membrane component KefB